MKRYLYLMILIVIVALWVPKDVMASEYNQETVFDYGDLLNAEEEEVLRLLSQNYEQYNMSAIFLTTNYAEGKSSRVYSDDFYDENNFKPDGVLFMIDMDNREIYVNTVGKGITIIDDYDVEKILDAGYPYVGNGEYFNCLKGMSDYTYQLIENYDEDEEYETTGSYQDESIVSDTFLPALSGALVVTVIVVIVLIVKHKKANRRIPAENYMGSNFHVKNKNVVYMGCRREVLRDYYKQQDNSSGGGSSHRSSGGISHGGGGRKF